MSTLEDLKQVVKQGQLNEALGLAKQLVTQSPLDAGVRSTLCALLFASGEIDRARNQFEAYRQLGGEHLPKDFAAVMETAEARKRALTGEETPTVPGLEDAPAWMATHREALARLHAGSSAELLVFLEDHFAVLSQISGRQDELEFEGFRNADFRLAPVLEGVFEGEYSWIPLEELRQVIIPAKPELVQDLFWVPAMVALKNGWRSPGYLFASYPDSHQAPDERARLAMATDWDEKHDEIDLGWGQQIFLAGDEALPLLSLGSCFFT